MCRANNAALFIVADDIEGEALQALVLNRTKKEVSLKVLAIKAPGYGHLKEQTLQDIAIMTGASVVSPSNGLTLDKVKLQHLGKAKRVLSDSKSTTIVGAGALDVVENVAKRVEDLREQMRDVTLSSADLNNLRVRCAKLASGIAVIKVGGSTELEMI